MTVQGSASSAGNESPRLVFHPIVDVLRALAVLSVVTYHAGMPGVSGGYVGVDVFFVISGFLIIGQIVAQHGSGRFSYVSFWSRRALRILPSYLLVILVSVPLAYWTMVMPREFGDFGREVKWSAMMVVNHLFLAEAGYFDTDAVTKPLLHLWSLAVEEQFYLVTPLVLGLLCWLLGPRFGQWGRRLVAAIVVAMFVASFWLCVRYTAQAEFETNYAFYLMPLRAWEFMIGGLVPLTLPWLRKWSSRGLMLLLAAGLGLILWAVFGFDHYTPFPSWRALFPAMGTAVVIAAGLAAPDARFVRALTLPPILWIGLVSYAWYLWHWPLMTFVRIRNFGELSLGWGMAMALLSLLLAAATYHFMEKPLKDWRKKRRIDRSPKLIIAGLLACAAVFGVGYAIAEWGADRIESGIPSAMLPGYKAVRGPCQLHTVKSVDRCVSQLRREGHAHLGAVLGDSHAAASFPVLQKLASRNDASLVGQLRVGCIPTVGIRLYMARSGVLYPCHQVKERGMRFIFERQVAPEFAIIYSRWNNATPWLDEQGRPGEQLRLIADSKTGQREPQEEVFKRSFRKTVQRLQHAGVKRILVILSTPEFPRDIPACVRRSDRYGYDRDRFCSVSQRAVDNRNYYSDPWLRDSVAGLKGIRVIDPSPVFCDGRTCRGFGPDEVFYRDAGHINNRGMNKIVERYQNDFDWVVGR